MKGLIFYLIVFPFICFGQKNKIHPEDSIFYYQHKLNSKQRQVLDSLRKTDESKETAQKIQNLRIKSDSYGAFVLFMEIAQADFDKFNASITPSGYEEIDGPAYRFGFGFSIKSDRLLTDFYFVTASLNKTANKITGTPSQNGSIKADFFSGAMLEFGYDFIRNNKINFYPYLGTSIRTCDLSFKGITTLNPAFTNITNLVTNKQSAEGSSIRFGYQAGVGLEFVTGRKNKAGGGILFIKAGTNRPIGKEKYKIEGVKYDPGIEYGKWVLAVGMKFFGRN